MQSVDEREDRIRTALRFVNNYHREKGGIFILWNETFLPSIIQSKNMSSCLLIRLISVTVESMKL